MADDSALAPDPEFMRLALFEGRRALPACLPNPPVGCVLKDGRVIARGFTQPPGRHHAEAMALSRVSGDLSDITAFVPLEPCAFHGGTPSCAAALAASGIRKVFLATLDPDPRNAGAGVEILRAAGIEVSVGLLEQAALEDLGDYLQSGASQGLAAPGHRSPGTTPDAG